MKDKLMIADSIKKMITRLDTVVVNFPRSEYVLRDNIMKTCYEMLELVYLANTINDDSCSINIVSINVWINYNFRGLND